jgi:hypothetical protein
MSNFFDKDDAEHIRMLNAASGYNHRSKPYNLNNPDDLSEMLQYAVGEFSDYRKYFFNLVKISEDFMAMTEKTQAAPWLNKGKGGKDSRFIENTHVIVNSASIYMGHMSVIATAKCEHALRIALEAPAHFQERIFGKAYTLSKDELDDFIKSFFEHADDCEYLHAIPDNYSNFVDRVNKELSEWAS